MWRRNRQSHPQRSMRRCPWWFPSEAPQGRSANLTIVLAKPSVQYGIVWSMSIDSQRFATAQLTPTSYLVLGLVAREGPSTPYDLKGHVAATIGHFWPFPHALLYKEPPRRVGLGLL